MYACIEFEATLQFTPLMLPWQLVPFFEVIQYLIKQLLLSGFLQLQDDFDHELGKVDPAIYSLLSGLLKKGLERLF